MKPIGHLILAHRDPSQLARLISALDSKADFFVHIDQKSDISEFRDCLSSPNVYPTPTTMPVFWAGFSIVEATLLLIRTALARGRYERLTLLNGLDYPIKSTAEINSTLLDNPSREYIRFFDVFEASDPQYHQSAAGYHFHDNPRILVNRFFNFRQQAEKLLQPVRRPPLKGIRHCFGHMQWALSGDCAQKLLEMVDADPRFARFYRFSFAPDEHFFHTLVANSAYCASAGGVEPFQSSGTAKMANLHHIHPSLDKTYTIDDFDELSQSTKLFTKKLTTKDSLSLIERIDGELRI